MYACRKLVGEAHLIGNKELWNNITYQKNVQEKNIVKNTEAVIWPLVHISGIKIGNVQSVVKETGAIIILL